jgi:formylglycine-generating enzyme required for sulfatase activity
MCSPRWMTMLLLAAGIGIGLAGELTIESLAPDGGLVFRTPDGGKTDHYYRVEYATSLSSAAWAPVWTAAGVGGDSSVTSPVASQPGAAYYRVVSTSNSAAFVDGPYLVIDVLGGVDATDYPVSFYDSSANVPSGVTSDTYKTTSLLLRRIPAGTFTMGSPTSELGRYSNETQHQVTLTKDFYIGVFEVTQKQWERVMGTWPSYFTNVAFRDTRPVECMTYDAIRGSIAGANWPTSYDVDADSFMGRLRARTGRAFDLPTEAQWEYAGRACSTTALNSGKNITVTGSDCSNLSAVARNLHNGGEPGWGHRESTTSAGTAAVGSYQANMWGLHDIHGNVWEWCLDWYGAYPGTVTDPKGLISGSSRVFRGGGWYHSNLYHRAAYRNYKSPSQGSNGLGFRVVSPSGQDGFTRSIMELEAPGQYVFSNLLGQLNYQVMAYRDINGNGIKDSFEPQGSHYNNPMYLTNSVTNGHITLVDPDTDGDGLSDAYELGYGRYQVVTGSYTWAEAKVDAETRGAHLATITSASEWNAICSVVPDIPCGLWLGGSDEEQEGVWRWVTGEPWGYTRWQPLEPDGNTSQNWLEIWADPSNSDRLWNDIGSTNLVCRPSNALT